MKFLTGLQRFVALGTLVLSNNDIGWAELAKIRHLHILDLYLHGNAKLEKDPYCKIFVIPFFYFHQATLYNYMDINTSFNYHHNFYIVLMYVMLNPLHFYITIIFYVFFYIYMHPILLFPWSNVI